MKLIDNFAELLHEVKLPCPEKCFVFEPGDEKFIEEWINNGELTCDLDNLFKWLTIKYKLKKKDLNAEERELCEEIKRRFPVERWRVIKLFSDHQRKYRYYKKAIEDVKSRTTPRMNEQAIMTIFSPGWGINT